MSYCRFVEADVYVFMNVNDWLECCGCWLVDDVYQYRSTQAMVDHLEAHKAAGHYVPDDVIPALQRDDAENFPGGKS